MGRRSGEKNEREVSPMASKIRASQTREVTKIDLRKEFKQFYSPPMKEAVLVEVPDRAGELATTSQNSPGQLAAKMLASLESALCV